MALKTTAAGMGLKDAMKNLPKNSPLANNLQKNPKTFPNKKEVSGNLSNKPQGLKNV